MDDEKRKEYRCNTKTEVTVGDVKGTICNLSMGGMMCFLPEPVPTMQELTVKFDIDGFSMEIIGNALRCEEITKDNFSTGIYFKSPSVTEEQRNKLALYLDKLRRKA
ncbi:MAG: PilZ domain-containing protein [Melioribacteraceae bacterium]|nr:PilZ domain-containing protein [Melioribacteraceae bacterium]